MYDICCIGHITKDEIITPTEERRLPGGTAYYFTAALQLLGVKHLLVTKLSEEYAHELSSGNYRDAVNTDHVLTLPSKEITFFQNTYHSNSPDDRSQKVFKQADPFSKKELKNIESKWFHLGPLLKGDIPLKLLKFLATKGKISLDAQGLLRKQKGTEIVPKDWKKKLKGLPLIDILKVNEEESYALTGRRTPELACEYLIEKGAKEVVLTLGLKGSLVASEGKIHKIKAYEPKQILDATGCGDTYMAGYLFKRASGASIEEAGKLGAKMASAKMEYFGALKELLS
ncbi:MAG: PfkB family carbohydrate kinase [Cyclobacteriaceae bacterium]